jgi:hypothetical protein
VVHDFACSLGDYCFSREPEFFKDTLFIIDKFHSTNHKSCTQSSKIHAYLADPLIQSINSNAAEHLNSGLKRLRTSVSGMSEKRSIAYVDTYVCVRNRLLLREYENAEHQAAKRRRGRKGYTTAQTEAVKRRRGRK